MRKNELVSTALICITAAVSKTKSVNLQSIKVHYFILLLISSDLQACGKTPETGLLVIFISSPLQDMNIQIPGK